MNVKIPTSITSSKRTSAVFLLLAFSLTTLSPTSLFAQLPLGGDVDRARVSWTPVRKKPQQASQPASQQAGKSNQLSKAEAVTLSAAPTRATTRQASSQQAVSKHAATRIPLTDPVKPQVRQTAQQVPVPMELPAEAIVPGTVVSESVSYGYGCDAIGCDTLGCDGIGCDSIGCDSMGCGDGCGCKLCGEIPSSRAWRPAVTFSLPQDGWFKLEGLAMKVDGMGMPPLVTSSPSGTAQADAGVLGLPTTTILVGNHEEFDNGFDGARIDLGFWFDRCHTWGMGMDMFRLSEASHRESFTSTGNPILARPFFNILTGNEDANLLAFDDNANLSITGQVSVEMESFLRGGGFYFRKAMGCEEGRRRFFRIGRYDNFCSRSDFRFGYRYMDLAEQITIADSIVSTSSVAPGQMSTLDVFRTENQFNGLDLAVHHRVIRGFWSFEGLVRLGVGNTLQKVRIDGSTTSTDQFNATTTEQGGLLALSSNIGNYTQDEFSVVPEINLTLGYQLTERLKATIGYTGIYWSNVVRPGQHISLDVNPDLLPPPIPTNGALRPEFTWDTTDYWAQGLHYGLEFRW
ncbi:MAG: hypothetical protein CBB71_05630 [Rhodopirellula sp. TMED11]|nr:MAG: hypothetical protein CBB71_05630 [Rhodopirellula sp. TMED11]